MKHLKFVLTTMLLTTSASAFAGSGDELLGLLSQYDGFATVFAFVCSFAYMLSHFRAFIPSKYKDKYPWLFQLLDILSANYRETKNRD